MLVIVLDVLFELGPVLGEIVAGRRHSHHVHVHEVGAAAHHPAGGLGPVVHHHPPPLQVFDGPGCEEGHSDAVAGGGRLVSHLVSEVGVVLHVQQLSHGLHAVAQAGVGGDVFDLLAVQVDLGLVVAQAFDVFRSCSGWHGSDSAVSDHVLAIMCAMLPRHAAVAPLVASRGQRA